VHLGGECVGSVLMGIAAVDLIWPHFLGGCSIRRDTEKWMKEAGSWSQFALKAPEDEFWYHMLPHVMGVATK
jgi:hypothetical protein